MGLGQGGGTNGRQVDERCNRCFFDSVELNVNAALEKSAAHRVGKLAVTQGGDRLYYE